MAQPPVPGSPITDDAVRAALRAALSAGLGAADRAAPGGLGRVVVTAASGSTSTELVAAATSDPGAWPDRSLLVTDHQTAGRGRAGRTWETPAGEALTFSVLLRPQVPPDRVGWLSLLGGLAVVHALADLGVEAGLKWPNDVLVVDVADSLPGWGRHRKVAGVLGERGAEAVVIGIGINVHQHLLPVPSATSLAACGVAADRAALLGAVVGALLDLDSRFRATDGDAVAAGLAAEVAAVCLTLGSRVRVSRPGGELLTGHAVGMTHDGGLRVVDDAGHEHAVLAGDVEHLRA